MLFNDNVVAQRETESRSFAGGLVVTKGLNIFSFTSGGMPVPLSRMRISTALPRFLVVASSVGSNPGPPFSVYMSGARIERMFPFGPPAGAAVNITLFSYDGLAQIGVRTDPAAVPNAERLMTDLRAGFREVLAVGS